MKVIELLKLVPSETNIAIGYIENKSCSINNSTADCSRANGGFGCYSCPYYKSTDFFKPVFEGMCNEVTIGFAEKKVIAIDAGIHTFGEGENKGTDGLLKIQIRKEECEA